MKTNFTIKYVFNEKNKILYYKYFLLSLDKQT